MSDNIIPFTPTHLNRFHFGVRNVKNEITRNRGAVEINQYCLIVMINNKTKREVVHPISSFIYTRWRNTKFNSQYARAKVIADFLNYVVIEKHTTFWLKSLEDLDVVHGLAFMENKIKRGCVRETIFKYDNTLMYLYYYLCQKGLLKNFKYDDFEWLSSENKRYKHLKSFFIPKITKLPPYSDKETKAKRLEEQHVVPFLQVALEVSPEIALGVYLSLFGGLRGSEVMSVKRSKIRHMGPNSANGMIVKLETDKETAKGSGNHVKQPGTQIIEAYNNGLRMLYELHMRYYPEPKDESDSLFLNKRGEAMQYQTYRQHFNYVKAVFIQRLKKSKNPDDQMFAVTYSSLRWSTHIGRGTYSNMVAEECSNLIELMLKRRDRSPQSSIVYMVSKNSEKRIVETSIDDMFERNEEK